MTKHKGGDEVEARGNDEQPLSDKPPLILCGETYSNTYNSSNLTTQNKVLCFKEVKEKCATFCFLQLKAKKIANFSKIIGGRVTFLVRM